MNTSFICLLLLLLNFKWLLFAIASPVIRAFNNHNRINSTNNAKVIPITENTPDNIKYSLIRNLKDHIYRFLNGYERYMCIQVGLIPSHIIRNFIYKKIFLIKMAPKSIIYYGAEIRGGHSLTLKEGAIVGDRCVLDARRGGIIIGESVQLGNFVNLWTGSHDYNDPYFRSMPNKRGPIKIGNRAWIGPSSTILHSVTIGEGAVVAAGSVVTKDVEPFSVVGGIPAKKIGKRTHDLKYDFTTPPIPFY